MEREDDTPLQIPMIHLLISMVSIFFERADYGAAIELMSSLDYTRLQIHSTKEHALLRYDEPPHAKHKKLFFMVSDVPVDEIQRYHVQALVKMSRLKEALDLVDHWIITSDLFAVHQKMQRGEILLRLAQNEESQDLLQSAVAAFTTVLELLDPTQTTFPLKKRRR
jgi:hypothetical protein